MAISTPLRLDSELVNDAIAEAARQKRSAPKQIEYWAELGQVIDGILSKEELIGLREGLFRLVPPETAAIDPDAVFGDLEASRSEGSLPQRVAGGVGYQISRHSPGLLERVEADGSCTPGRFSDGVFQPINSPAGDA